MMSRCSWIPRALLGVVAVLVVAVAVVPEGHGGEGPVGFTSRQLRRIARRLDKALIQVDRAVSRLHQKNGARRARRHLVKAQRKLEDFLDDANIQLAYDELDAAILVTEDPFFSPQVDITPVTDHTDVASASVIASVTYDDSHIDGVFLLGTSKSFSRTHEDTNIFVPLGRTGPFDVLRVRAVTADLYVDRLRINFADGEPVQTQSHRGIHRLRSRHSRQFVLQGEFIDSIDVTAQTRDFEDTDRGRLKFWGISTD